jgi:AraC family transcriptional regulator of adaptative response/methylated-DNA-[protein]-cysteine methyltransferase
MKETLLSKPSSYFKEAFNRMLDDATTKTNDQHILKASWLETPLGTMLAIGNDDTLYLLEFVDLRDLERRVERLRKKTHCFITSGKAKSIDSIEKELTLYFKRKLKHFKTPFFLIGTPFQKRVWEELLKIPFGETCSYAQLANNVGNPKGYRAVARANGANQFPIIIPCHRVINASGELGGYGGGLSRKNWLLQHEKSI